VQFYDAHTGAWNRRPSLPSGVAYGSNAATPAGFEILGGATRTQASRQIWRLDRTTRTWRASGELSFDTLLSRAEAIDHQVFVFGGCPDLADLTNCSNAVMLRDPAGNPAGNNAREWTRISTLPQGAVAVVASAISGKSIFLFGGCTLQGKTAVTNLAAAWKFDTVTRTWHPLQSLPKPVRGATALSIGTGRILIVGGYTDSGFISDALIYDVNADRYLPSSPLPLPASNVSLVRLGQSILAIGGEDRMKGRTPRVFEGILDR
jgi:N-acetylneuraminic acid mutarotase